MAASLTKTLPRAVNFLISQRLGGLTAAFCSSSTQSLCQYVSNEPLFQKRYNRQLCTYSQLRQIENDMIKAKTEAGQAVQEESEDEELDVLYKKLVIEVKGHEPKVLQSYETFVKLAAQHLGIKIDKISKPKYHVYRNSVLRSVFIYKKHFSQFEQRTYFLIFEIPKLTGSTADTFLEYIQRNLPEGAAMKVTRHRLEKIPDHLVPPNRNITDTVKNEQQQQSVSESEQQQQQSVSESIQAQPNT